LILVRGSTSQDSSKASKMEPKNYPQLEEPRLSKPWLSLVMGLLDVPSLSRVIPQPAIRELSSQLLACVRPLFVSTYRSDLGSVLATSESFRSAEFLRQVRTRRTGTVFASCCSSQGPLHVSFPVHFSVPQLSRPCLQTAVVNKASIVL